MRLKNCPIFWEWIQPPDDEVPRDFNDFNLTSIFLLQIKIQNFNLRAALKGELVHIVWLRGKTVTGKMTFRLLMSISTPTSEFFKMSWNYGNVPRMGGGFCWSVGFTPKCRHCEMSAKLTELSVALSVLFSISVVLWSLRQTCFSSPDHIRIVWPRENWRISRRPKHLKSETKTIFNETRALRSLCVENNRVEPPDLLVCIDLRVCAWDTSPLPPSPVPLVPVPGIHPISD